MCNCKNCGIDLTALNISDDDEDYCQKCFAELVDKLPVDDESEETKQFPDWGLDVILSSPYPQSITPEIINIYKGNARPDRRKCRG